jgi:SAM-dependent methyltransferase
MKNLKDTYGKYHIEQAPIHIYPTEWIIRTLLGNYPGLMLKKDYTGCKILDIGFGDCRNMPLLANLGFDIYGIEITDEIIEISRTRLQNLNIHADLRTGTNTNIPFPDNYFDYILSSFSMYYIDNDTNFNDNVVEYMRVLKTDGVILTTLAEPQTFIFKDCLPVDNSHVIIRNDPFGLRNGYKLRWFKTRDEVAAFFERSCRNVSIGYSYNDYYGLTISYFMVVAYKK